MRIISLQPSEFVDHITEDGTELTKLPYPFHVQPDGKIQRQDFWRGDPSRVIGFVADLAARSIDLYWEEYVQMNPERAVGLYVVTGDKSGGIGTHQTAIRDVEVHEVEDPRPEITEQTRPSDGITRYDR